MQMNRFRVAFLASTMISGSVFLSQPVMAQDAAPAAATGNSISRPDTKASVTAPSGEIVVTGSLFRRADLDTPSPVTVLTTDTLSKAGITTINDAIRSISADGAGSISTGFQGGFSAGGAAVSLRGLGVSSTLVLIDGLRSTNFPLNDDGHNSYVDLNSIPFSAVERVEVLKDGASSSYGADAIGGVVNIIMKKHFVGVAGGIEGGISGHGDASRYRANLTAGIGDYAATGWNFYVNGEYQRDGRVSAADRGFPYNTTDLSSIGGLDKNTADSALNIATINAVVRRTTQGDLNDPFTGSTAAANGQYTTLNLSNCVGNTYTVAGAAGGVGCKHDNTAEYGQIQPRQERYNVSGRLSIRINDNIDAYVTGSYSHSEVDILGTPPAIRQRQPYGALSSSSSANPGIVLPYFVCASGVNCATSADRRLNPNNPYATNINATAADAAQNAALIYYLFGDIPSASRRKNELIRGAAGLHGHFGDGWDWHVDAVGAKDNFTYESYGVINIAGLKQAVNTGTYNFINPSLNSDAVRQLIAPTLKVPSHTSMASLDASISKSLVDLPGGPLQVAVGGQVRREIEENNSLKPDLENYANTAAAFGKHTVSAGYFELDAPILKQLDVNASGRYDHYSEGFSHFSPKVGVKFTPIKEISLRGTFSKGFRAPTFAESNPRSSYPGFVNFTPPCSFVLAHGGTGTLSSCSAGSNPYAQTYAIGGGFSGNPDLKPEKSRSFTAGLVVQPKRWLSLTVDYYNVKKTDVIIAGPLASAARAAYFAGQPLPAGYTVGAVDAVDPLYPNALPRVLVINGPYVNAGYQKTSGLDVALTANVPITDDLKFISRLDVTDVFNYTVDNGDGVPLKYVGTMGPYELSSGAGTPKWRGNWQNTIQWKKFSLTATTYFVSHIKAVAADEVAPDDSGKVDLSCDENLYGTEGKFCWVEKFIYADVHAAYDVSDKFSFYLDIGNITNAKAPIAPASYSGTNYLPTWHYAGVIGRTFRAGASFKF
jgi:iron complex outermembrane recepter protein